jgi:hypothetical protein
MHRFFTPLCKLRVWFWPPTPMGPTVIALRTIFLVIELMPISFKILQSIRPRRPYDVAKAALEHASMLRSYRTLDAALHDVSVDMVGQSAKARQPTTGSAEPRGRGRQGKRSRSSATMRLIPTARVVTPGGYGDADSWGRASPASTSRM